MADKAHEQTDQILERMERHLSAIYSKAGEEVGQKWQAYLIESNAGISKLERELDNAIKSGDKKKANKLEKEIVTAKTEFTLANKRFRDLSQQLAQEIAHVNETAIAYVNGRLPEVYALNYNALDEEADISGYSFTQTDAHTVKLLATTDEDLLPYKYLDLRKDMGWNMGVINSEVLQGILQGEPMDKIANRLQNVGVKNRNSAVRNARTMVTGAECKGRQDSYVQAEKDGLILKRVWISTHDARTRNAHVLLDGKEAEIDKPFSSELGEIMFPGDPHAEPANTYNCRCTIKAKFLGFKKTSPPPDTTGAMRQVPKVAVRGSHSSIVTKTNPKYKTAWEFGTNCANCVVADELRERGYDVTALGRDKKKKISYFWYDTKRYVGKGSWTDCFDGIMCEDVHGTRKTNVKGKIADKMVEYGNGSRAVVFVEWDGASEGHYFTTINDNGNVRFLDPQNGKDDVSDYFDRVKPSRTRIFRIDDKRITDFAREVVDWDGK